MKIFLCWSQERSRKLAEAMKEWLVHVVPVLSPRDVFFSPEITKGGDWFTEVQRRLAASGAAVICLTPENVKSPWMHFEAGAVLGRLAKKNVFPYLFGLRPEDVQGPLGSFQVTTTNEGDTRRLAEDLCRLVNTQLPADYDDRWRTFRGTMEEIKVEHISEVVAGFGGLFQRKTFDEELKECTNQTWADRYMGARETQKALAGQQEMVRRVCRPHQAELFGRLVSTIDGYAGLMKGFLIGERQFAYTESGEVDFTRTHDGRPHPGGESIAPAVERRLKQIKRLVYLLDTSAAAPAVEGAVEFSRLTGFAERKEVVRAKQEAIRGKTLTLTKEKRGHCRESIWELDRIVFYLWAEASRTKRGQDLLRAVEGELERLRSREDHASAMPLHYAVRALAASRPAPGAPGLKDLLGEVEKYLGETGRDGGRQISSNLKKIREAGGARAKAPRG